MDRVFRHLNLLETAYFGLRYLDHGNQTVRTLHLSMFVPYRLDQDYEIQKAFKNIFVLMFMYQLT